MIRLILTAWCAVALSVATALSLFCQIPTSSGDREAVETGLEGIDLVDKLRAINERVDLPPAEFESGHVETLEFEADRVRKTDDGFVIRLPSESPIPTPTVSEGRLYVSGGFSSKEYYCFEAQTGKLEWAVQLDDDGPSSAIPFEDSILFSCESCTLFALDAKSGTMRWSHWLGDPLLSMPALAGRDVFAVYPATPESELPQEIVDEEVEPTHIIAAFDAATGKLRWRRWIDSDCMTSPVVAGEDLYVTSLAGTLYRFGRKDGKLRLAERVRATSAPVAVGERVYLSRRADDAGATKVTECIAGHERATNAMLYAAARHAAPYLDQAVQREAAFSKEAEEFEASNAIGGGFGGGFFSVPAEVEQEPSDNVAGIPAGQEQPAAEPVEEAEEQFAPADALAATQLQAADVIGLGNVSTLQAFHGSRPLYREGRLYSCMGDRLVCLKADSGKLVWKVPLDGDLRKAGGHLATPPIAAGDHLLVATIGGKLLLIDPDSGKTERTWDVGSPVRFPPTVDAGRIYLGTQDGKVVCIETGDAGLTGWPMAGGDPGHTNSARQGDKQP